MQDVFDEQDSQQKPAEQSSQGESQQQAAPQGEAGEGNGAPPATEHTDKHVPLAALEAERKGRQDWKEKAIRAEAERDALRQQVQNGGQGQAPRQLDTTEMVLNERFNMSEMLASKEYPDLEEKLAVFQQAMQKNPALHAQMLREKHPYDFAYREALRIQARDRMGDDPAAYEAKLRKEIEDKVRAELQPSKPETKLPASLAGDRSAGSRGSTWTGPPPLETMFPN